MPAMLGTPRDFTNFAPLRIRPARIKPAGVLVFFGLTLVAFYLAEIHGRQLPLIAYLLGGMDDSNLHTAGKDSRLQVVAFGIHSASIFLFYLALNAPRRSLRAIFILLSLGVVALGLLKASKSDIFIPALAYAGLSYYHYRVRNRKLPKKLLLVMISSLLLVVSITSVRLQGVGITEGYSGLIQFHHSDLFGPLASEIISIVYGYTALGFQNFSNYLVSHPHEFRLGTSLFRPVLSALMMGAEADAMGVPVERWNVVSDAANTGTFLTPLYIEGGVLFCILGSLLYGSLVNTVYFWFRKTGSAAWMFAYISLLFPWTWLFFTNAFSVLSIYVNLVYIAVLALMFMNTTSQRWVPVRLVQLRENSVAPLDPPKHRGQRP
jgi:oligosaccharide repeat unit polymerase